MKCRAFRLRIETQPGWELWETRSANPNGLFPVCADKFLSALKKHTMKHTEILQTYSTRHQEFVFRTGNLKKVLLLSPAREIRGETQPPLLPHTFFGAAAARLSLAPSSFKRTLEIPNDGLGSNGACLCLLSLPGGCQDQKHPPTPPPHSFPSCRGTPQRRREK